MSEIVDEKYYQVVRANSVAERLLIKARARIYFDFLTQMSPAPSDSVLDVGVSDVVNDGANVLEREYPYQDQITACGLGQAEAFRKAFPKSRYQQITAERPLPFADGSFKIATANAVLEHVGSIDNQAFFLRELVRVAEKVFITVPHRYFPIEHHTSLPLVHYNDALFRAACRLFGKSEWTHEENLILMTRKRLHDLARLTPKSASIGYTGLRLGPFSSNLFLALT